MRDLIVVPHFMRLHEWIALEEGLFEQAGLSVAVDGQKAEEISGHRCLEYGDRPQDHAVQVSAPVVETACEWAVPLNAAAGIGKAFFEIYGIARFGVFVPKDSPVSTPEDLASVDVAVGEMAGSHFSFLRSMEKRLDRGAVKTVNLGGPGARLEALIRGDVRAANLLDPMIGIAEQLGFRAVLRGRFRTLLCGSRTIDEGLLNSYRAVLKQAQQALLTKPEAFYPLWARNIPAAFQLLGLDYARLGLGELLRFKSYGKAAYDRARKVVCQWGLDDRVREEIPVPAEN